VPTGSLLPDLLKTLGLADVQVALEINGELVPKRKWPVRELSAGDRIEVVTLVGGG
jgi:sulfur carrier protein